MCCPECLAKSGVTAWQGDSEDGLNTAAPHLLRNYLAAMVYMDNGDEEALRWTKPWTPGMIPMTYGRVDPIGMTLNALDFAMVDQHVYNR